MEKILKTMLKAWEEYDKTGILPEQIAKKKKVLISINESVFQKFKKQCAEKNLKYSNEIEALVKAKLASS